MRLGYLFPLVVFGILSVVLYVGLSLEPKKIPSALIDKPVPEFDLDAVKGRTLGLKTADLENGEVALVNVFASWCGPCRVEHPLWMDVAEDKQVPLHGINYKDDPDNASKWLDRYGDPYERTGADRKGKAGIEWGVYGVPETFVIDAKGRIRYKHVGVMTRDVLNQSILPLVEQLQEQAAAKN